MVNETISDPYLIETYNHVELVRSWMGMAQDDLERRALDHDQSKFDEPEMSGFREMAQELKLAETAYGSPEYRAILKKYKASTIDHHYAHNDHHPEHFPNGIAGMSLGAIYEMLCDWNAATKRMKDGGDLLRSIEINQERFGYSDDVRDILVNTARELGMIEKEDTDGAADERER